MGVKTAARKTSGLPGSLLAGSLLALGLLAGGCIPTAQPCNIGGLPGLVDGSLLNPYPSMHLMSGGEDCRVTIGDDVLDLGTSQALNLQPMNRRDGFSVGNTMVWQPGSAVDPGSFPGQGHPELSLEEGASIQLWDLEAGVRLPFFAEIDAYPDQQDAWRVLLIRPLQALGFDRRIAVVVTEALLGTDGQPIAPPSAFEAIRDEDGTSDLDPRVVAHYHDLLGRLEGLGLVRDTLTFAWDFRTGSSANVRAPLNRVLEEMRAALPLDPTFQPEVVISLLHDTDAGDDPTGNLWREVRGSLILPHFLWDDGGEAEPTESDHDHGWFSLDDEGLPLVRADAPAYFTLAVPDSLREAPAGSAPVVIFGHGVFSNPQQYIASGDDYNSTMRLCDRLGAICIGTEWRGLTLRDSPDALRAAMDLSRFPLLTDKLHQGVANQLGMARMMRSSFTESSFLLASDGTGSLVDPERIYYFGISLGGIEGATLMANSEVVDTGVLHVPGALWTTILDRSVHWGDFEPYVTETQPDPVARQFAYSALQLYWDPVDPINHTEGFSGQNILWQVSRGDEQVPNFTAETLARSAGIPLAEPRIWDVLGLGQVQTPSAPGTSAVFQWDSGIPGPEETNRPPPAETGAHHSIRHLVEVDDQVEAYFQAGQEGTVLSPCGGPCVFELAEED